MQTQADLNVQDHFHDTPLDVAILNRKLEVALSNSYNMPS